MSARIDGKRWSGSGSRPRESVRRIDAGTSEPSTVGRIRPETTFSVSILSVEPENGRRR